MFCNKLARVLGHGLFSPIDKEKSVRNIDCFGQYCSDCLLPMMLTANKQGYFWAVQILLQDKEKCFIALTLYYYFSLSQDK
jgi:hypothetical protein